jgi:hypothetical protein
MCPGRWAPLRDLSFASNPWLDEIASTVFLVMEVIGSTIDFVRFRRETDDDLDRLEVTA